MKIQIAIALFIANLVPLAVAGTPGYVAGVSYFDPAVKGQPITWAQGQIPYYTDQGDLSPLLQQPAADAFVADSFSRWTSIPTAAVAASRAGQLSENVNGSNVTVDSSGAITVPADIQSSATAKPLAIVYDTDGAVTDALLGAGAGLPGNCFTNAAFGGIDNFSPDGHFAHGLVVVNGNCAQSAADLVELQYRLVRVLGEVLGLGWSQLNLNVITRKPQAANEADRDGFPVMHFMDSISCVPISICRYNSPDQPKTDDRAALSRLYPVTAQNISSFPGKVLFADNTARVHGSVYFIDGTGRAAQPMQGVNVVARYVDPSTNVPSGRYAASSISGFLFRGNAGNPVTGFTDAIGQPFDRFGSDDTAVEGFFDLAGLEIPNAASSATFELTVEAVDPLWSEGVQPYGPWQVQPSGAAGAIRVTVTKGGEVQQDIVMTGSASESVDSREPETFATPAPVPNGGDWTGSLSGYGDTDFYWLSAQANRTMSVEITAVDGNGAATQDRARPVIGMWSLSAPEGVPPGAATPTAFSTTVNGLSRLDAQLSQTAKFRIGVADERGDGRPDYRYHARVLYGDSVVPARLPVSAGTPVVINGMGFRPGMAVTIGSKPATVLSTTSTQIIAAVPALADGLFNVTLTDPASGGSSVLADVLTAGAGPNDLLQLLQGGNSPTPAGTEATNPFRVRVVGPDSAPVAGATVVFSSSPAAQLSVCSGAPSCVVVTDATGEVATRMTAPTAGTFSIYASLAPASYAMPQSVQATLSATSAAPGIAFVNGERSVAEGASFDMPITVRVVNNGTALSGKTINFAIVAGSATLTFLSAVTNPQGYATTTLQLRSFAGHVQISACVEPGDVPCATMNLYKVALANIRLQMIAGGAQLIFVGQPFQPVAVRAVDSSVPPNPVEAANVSFTSTIFRPDFDVYTEPVGETRGGQTSMPVILGSSQVSITSDSFGLATLVATAGSVTGPVEIEVVAFAGSSASQFFELESIQPIVWFGSAIAIESDGQLPASPLEKDHRRASHRYPEGRATIHRQNLAAE